MASKTLQDIFQYVDDHKDLYVSHLGEAVAIKSVSGLSEFRNDLFDMVDHVFAELQRVNATVWKVHLGLQPDSELHLPDVILGYFGNDPTKKTVCIYGHVDVQPADRADGWDTEPFELTNVDGKLYGRGSSDDKGPVLAWINVIEAYQELEKTIPINIKFCIEGMEESGSLGLEALVIREKEEFFKDVDYFCISDNYWLGTEKPCITYGLRGICYFHVKIQCAGQDLHSGIHGGVVHEAMTDLVNIFNSLVNTSGDILIPCVNDSVRELTEEEEATYEPIEFDVAQYCEEIGVEKLTKHTKAKVLQHRWRFPSLSIHGIEGAWGGEGDKTTIPYKVIGKFSIRLVPDQEPDQIESLVREHITSVQAASGSPNQVVVTMTTGAKPMLSDYTHDHFTAGRNAVRTVFGVDPDLTREGGSIPVTLTFQEVIGKNIMLLPMGASDDGAHSQNEKINCFNFIEGIKVLAAYFEEVASWSNSMLTHTVQLMRTA